MIIPIGHDQTVRRFPWLTTSIVVLCVLVQVLRRDPVTPADDARLAELARERQAILDSIDMKQGGAIVRKMGAEDPHETISGTFGLSGGVDNLLVLKCIHGSHEATLSVTGRDIREIPIALREKRPPSIQLMRRVPRVLRGLLQLGWTIRVRHRYGAGTGATQKS